MTKKIESDLLDIYGILLRTFGPRNWWPADTPEEVIFGAILTQNTNWKNVMLALAALKQAGKMSLRRISRMEAGELAPLIRSSGFYNQKALALKNFSAYMDGRYGFSLEKMAENDLEALREELLGQSRIGRETADSILLYALGKPIFVVDAYTKRIFSRHGYLRMKDPYDLFQKFFMDNLPHDPALFNEFHALIVRTGHLFCKPTPLCGGCPLANWKKGRSISAPAKSTKAGRGAPR